MKKEIKKNHFAVFPLLALLVVSAPISLSAAVINVELKAYQDNKSISDHSVLAERYENMAKEMRAQVKEQEALLMNEMDYNYLGNYEQPIKSSKVVRIRGCKHAIKENLAKAAYHRSMATKQEDQDAVVDSGQGNEQMNKVKEELNLNSKMHSL